MTSPRERAQLQAQLRQQQEALVRDLLPVLDALDRADAHWQQVLAGHPRKHLLPRRFGGGLWGRLRLWLAGPQASQTLARSAGEGISLIRGNLLEVLRSHGLETFESVGQPFDPQRMRAIGQRPAMATVAAGSVVAEAVRGYLWQRTLLREAQVLVAAP